MSSHNHNLYDEPIKATSESAEWIFFATILGLQMLSAACDQASSPRKSHYALFGMLLAIAAVLISIWELTYRGQTIHVQDNKDSMENSSSTEETSKHATTKYYAPTNIPSLDDQEGEVEGNIVGCRRVASREVLAGDGHVGGGWDEAMAKQVQEWQQWRRRLQWRTRGHLI
ncbi:unnamed protein product [Prunus armeniaca]